MVACCFCKHSRPAILAWIYIKLAMMLLSLYPLYLAMAIIIFYRERYDMILFGFILLSYPTAFGFDITLIVATHLRNVKTLRVCLYYLIIELIMLILLVPWIGDIVFNYYSVNYYNVMSLLPFIAVVTVVVIAQGVFSIIMVISEIGKLSDAKGVAHEEVGYTNLKNGNATSSELYN